MRCFVVVIVAILAAGCARSSFDNSGPLLTNALKHQQVRQ